MKYFLAALVFLCIGAINSSLPAGEKKAKGPMLRGEVTIVDAEANSLSVKEKLKKGAEGEPAIVAFTTNDETRVRINKENKTFADVIVGDHVVVKYTEEGDTKIATLINIRRKGEQK